MNRFATVLLSVLLAATVSSSQANVANKTYSGSYKGQPCSVRMTWYNWEGLGSIAGTIKVASGPAISFTGSNSQPGVLELTAAGEPFRLVRKDAGKAVTWSSPRFSFTEGPAPTPTPSPTPAPTVVSEDSFIPESEMPPSRIADETYAGAWRGQQFTAQIRWAPSDEPQAIRRGRGTVTLANGQKLSIEATQSSAEAAEFVIKPDASGETYKATKTSRDGSDSWESGSLTLTQTK